MAGSYLHCVTDEGKLRDPIDLNNMLECMSGDVTEAVTEMYGMIWFLANNNEEERSLPPAERVELARQNYRWGLAMSPGVVTES